MHPFNETTAKQLQTLDTFLCPSFHRLITPWVLLLSRPPPFYQSMIQSSWKISTNGDHYRHRHWCGDLSYPHRLFIRMFLPAP